MSRDAVRCRARRPFDAVQFVNLRRHLCLERFASIKGGKARARCRASRGLLDHWILSCECAGSYDHQNCGRIVGLRIGVHDGRVVRDLQRRPGPAHSLRLDLELRGESFHVLLSIR